MHTSDGLVITSEDLDTACVPLLAQLRARRVVDESQLLEIVPPDHTDVYAWLSCYGQCRAWLAGGHGKGAKRDDQPDPDTLVTAALREAPIPVAGLDGVFVYPKSFEALLQIGVLNAQNDRFTARLVTMIGDDASLIEIDGGVEVASAVAYVVQLMAWAWTSEGCGLPFKATDPTPIVPAHVTEWTPTDLLAITRAAHEFGASLAACQELIDPVPARDGGRRPSWAAFFEAVGAQAQMDPKELAVSSSLTAVLARAYLASDRQRPRDGDAG